MGPAFGWADCPLPYGVKPYLPCSAPGNHQSPSVSEVRKNRLVYHPEKCSILEVSECKKQHPDRPSSDPVSDTCLHLHRQVSLSLSSISSLLQVRFSVIFKS